MNAIKHTVVAVVAATALSLVTACSDVQPPANDIGQLGDEKSKAPVPKGHVRTNPNRMDFGDGKATLPAKPKAPRDHNRSRLDFGDDGRS
ncbi:MAG TPA: hypothetical protein VLK03_15000 [Nocardioides sp.]|nr:hypothetical protein [Nocardioides sp.]